MHYLKKLTSAKKAYLIFFLGVLQLIALHFILSFNSGNQNQNTPDEVTLYFADNISPAQKELISQFNEEHKGKIKVELLNIPLGKFSSNERKQLFVKYLRSESERVDVFAIDQVWIPRFAKWAEPLDNYFSQDDRNRLTSAVLQVSSFNNFIAAAPEFMDIGVMYYREDILETRQDYKALKEKLANSITWEDFINLGLEYIGSGQPFYTFPADNYEGLLCSFTEVYANSDNHFQEGINFQQEKAKDAIQFLSNLVNKYKISPPEVTELQEININKYFLEKNGLFLRGWPNTFKYYFPDNDESKKISRLIKVPLPHFKNRKKAFVLGGWNLMISKYSKHKKEAAEFIKFLLSDNAQMKMFEQNGFLPSINKFYNSKDKLLSSEFRFYSTIFPDAITRPRAENYSTYSNLLSFYMKSAIKGDISASEAAFKTEKELSSSFAGEKK